MLKRSLIIVLFWTQLCAPISAQDSGVLSDPMRPFGRVTPTAAAAPTYKLSGTFITPAGRVAVINGRSLREGDRVDGAEVLSIRAKSARIRRGKREFTLYVGSNSGRQQASDSTIQITRKPSGANTQASPGPTDSSIRITRREATDPSIRITRGTARQEVPVSPEPATASIQVSNEVAQPDTPVSPKPAAARIQISHEAGRQEVPVSPEPAAASIQVSNEVAQPDTPVSPKPAAARIQISHEAARQEAPVSPEPIAPVGRSSRKAVNPVVESVPEASGVKSLPEFSAPVVSASSSRVVDHPRQAAQGRYGPVQRGETLSVIAHRHLNDGLTLNQMMMALFQANPQAFSNNINILYEGAVLRFPDAVELRVQTPETATADVRQQQIDWWQNRQQHAGLPKTRAQDTYGPVQRGETLFNIAQRHLSDGITIDQMTIALFDANPQAFNNNINVLYEGAVLRIPREDELRSQTPETATAEVARQTLAWRANVSQQVRLTPESTDNGKADTPVPLRPVLGELVEYKDRLESLPLYSRVRSGEE